MSDRDNDADTNRILADLCDTIDGVRTGNQLRHATYHWVASRSDGASLDVRNIETHPGPTPGSFTVRADLIDDAATTSTQIELDVSLSDRDTVNWPPHVRVAGEAAASSTSAPTGVNDSSVWATLYAWLGLMEGLGVRASFARDLITKDVTVSSPAGPIASGADAVVDWVGSQQQRITRSCHHIADARLTSDGSEHDLDVQFVWQGIDPLDQPMVATTRHHWHLQDHEAADGGYARIATMQIEVLEPFNPVDANEALRHLQAAAQ